MLHEPTVCSIFQFTLRKSCFVALSALFAFTSFVYAALGAGDSSKRNVGDGTTSGAVNRAPTMKLVADTTKLNTYSLDLEMAEALHGPFAAVFKRGPKTLIFIAAYHENRESTRTFKLISEAFKHYPIDEVVVEGVEHKWGVDSHPMLDSLLRGRKGEFWQSGEVGYAAFQAHQHNVPYVGGEPDEEDVCKDLLSKGYSQDDILSFFFVRQIPQMKRDGTLAKLTAAQSFVDTMNSCPSNLGRREKFTFDEFLNWYRQKIGSEFDISKVQNDDTAPLVNSKILTQRMSAAVGKIRDAFIVQRIADALNEHDCVLVEYGRGHIVVQRPVLEDMLGKPIRQYN